MDADTRSLERVWLASGDVNDYIKYWAGLARTGYEPAITRIKIIHYLQKRGREVDIQAIELILLKKAWRLIPSRTKRSILQNMINNKIHREYATRWLPALTEFHN